MSQRPFHIAIPVDNLEVCRNFYREVLGCTEGRSNDHWVDLNFYGHQLVIHKTDDERRTSHNPVDGKSVPIPHYGVILTWDKFDMLDERLRKHRVKFVIEPYVRHKGKAGEQKTMFFYDPAGNALEFKAFKNDEEIFKS